ncbi:hypothetical protein E2C01_084492 [Portunus trituberculatus]|uniref:Uncharacterized protein n=1 Tax=Portunus trituberculatus TaxID=210409 RepID=A0A5B7IYE9_PORTR|nr:hypothetical protein [Portunus trituberculatus]
MLGRGPGMRVGGRPVPAARAPASPPNRRGTGAATPIPGMTPLHSFPGRPADTPPRRSTAGSHSQKCVAIPGARHDSRTCTWGAAP